MTNHSYQFCWLDLDGTLCTRRFETFQELRDFRRLRIHRFERSMNLEILEDSWALPSA